MYPNEGQADCAKSPAPLASRGVINAAASVPPTVQSFLQENDRLIKEAHEAITQLEAKLDPILPRSKDNSVGAAMAAPTQAANSELAAALRDQGEYISGIIRRINALRYAVDLQ